MLAKLTKLETSCIEMFHSENMSSINRFQTKGLEGLAISSRFSRSAIKITEKENCCHSSHGNAMCLYEVSFVKLERILFEYEP